MAIFVHLASVWVPFTSEAKEAVAHYPELLREITLALQECGRRLYSSLRARAKAESEMKRKSLFERYIPELGQSIGKITGQDRDGIEKLFLRALPNFVNVEAAEPEPPAGGTPNGAPPAAAEANGEDGDSGGEPSKPKGAKKGKDTEKVAAAPKAKGKGKAKQKGPPPKLPKSPGKKGEQLTLLE